MQFGICILSVIPARKEPAGTSEMVTQLLFGETYTVLEPVEGWLRVRVAFDGYECWISDKQHTRISADEFNALQNEHEVYSTELVQIIHNKSAGGSFPITIGARLPLLKANRCVLKELEFQFEGATVSPQKKQTGTELLNTAFLFLNAPYLWGGKNPFGIDCSGFTQLVYKLGGYKLPRDAWQQVELGEPLSFVDEALAGDLAFFDNEEGRIVHVGILLNNHEIIHASGNVRIDKFDHYGIHHSGLRSYTHRLRVIKRVA